MKPRGFAIVVWLGAAIGLVGFVLVAVVGAFRLRNARQQRISNPLGLDDRGFVELGGIEQFVTIRGHDRANPVLIFVHGGPGFPLTYLAHHFQPALEAEYTVVHWEQRLCGRTFYRNPDHDSASVEVETLVDDLDQLIEHVRERLQPDAVVLLGQSWGSVLALEYLEVHPDRVQGYIGVGQVVDFDEGKRLAARTALATLPDEHPDARALRASLDAFASVRDLKDVDVPVLEALVTRALAHLEPAEQLSAVDQVWLGLTSPTLSGNDVRWFLRATDTADILALQRTLVDHLYFDFEAPLGEPDVPMCFVQGEHDWITPTVMVHDLAARLGLPDGAVQVVPQAGHTPFLDNPEAFAEAIRKCELRP